MADWATIASLSTAGGTLVLAVATFASVRSANRSARVAERSLQLGIRPVLVPSRAEAPTEQVMFGDGVKLEVRGGTAAIKLVEERVYLALPLRNVGSGLAVMHGWHVWPERRLATVEHADPEVFRRQQVDLYVAAGDTGYWLGALREPGERETEALRATLAERQGLSIELLYGDHEGGQRTISRFALAPIDRDQWRCSAIRHWSIEGRDPRR